MEQDCCYYPNDHIASHQHHPYKSGDYVSIQHCRVGIVSQAQSNKEGCNDEGDRCQPQRNKERTPVEESEVRAALHALPVALPILPPTTLADHGLLNTHVDLLQTGLPVLFTGLHPIEYIVGHGTVNG